MTTRLTRNGQPPLLVDTDEPMASWSGHHFAGREQNRWYELAVYRDSHVTAVAVAYRTTWQGESDYHWATSGTDEHVAQWLAELGDPPTPPTVGYPPTDTYAERQARLLDTLRTQWRVAVAAALDREEFAVAQDPYPDQRAMLYEYLMQHGRTEIRDSGFTAGELSLICETLNGTILLDSEYTWWPASVEDSIRLNRLDAKWSVDPDELMPKIRALSVLGKIAMADAMQRFWREDKYRDATDTARAFADLKLLGE